MKREKFFVCHKNKSRINGGIPNNNEWNVCCVYADGRVQCYPNIMLGIALLVRPIRRIFPEVSR